MTLVYANIAISWQLLRFNSLKKHFPQIYRIKRFENGLEKKFPDLKFFPWFWLKTPCFSLISLTGKSLQNFPWIPWFPWSVGTLPLHQITRALVTRANYFATMFYFSWVFQIRSVEKLKVGVDLLNVDVSDIKQKWRRIFLKWHFCHVVRHAINLQLVVKYLSG